MKRGDTVYHHKVYVVFLVLMLVASISRTLTMLRAGLVPPSWPASHPHIAFVAEYATLGRVSYTRILEPDATGDTKSENGRKKKKNR